VTRQLFLMITRLLAATSCRSWWVIKNSNLVIKVNIYEGKR
jgi:hypothetical protein